MFEDKEGDGGVRDFRRTRSSFSLLNAKLLPRLSLPRSMMRDRFDQAHTGRDAKYLTISLL